MKILRGILNEISDEFDIEIDGIGDLKKAWKMIVTESPKSDISKNIKRKIELEKKLLNEKKKTHEGLGNGHVYSENDFEGEYTPQKYRPKKYAPKEKTYHEETSLDVHEPMDYDNSQAYEKNISEKTFSDDLSQKLRDLQNPQNAREAFVYSLIFDRRGRWGNRR